MFIPSQWLPSSQIQAIECAHGGRPGIAEKADAFFEVANLFSKHAGLAVVVWILYRGGAQHDV
jgi:hypothetical protein